MNTTTTHTAGLSNTRVGRWSKSLASALLCAVCLGAPAQAEPIELIYNIFIPPNAGITKFGLAPWAREVEEASGGTLKLTIPTSSLAPVPQLWDAVEDGVADIALVVNAFRAKQIALPTILALPLVDGNAEQVSRAWWETYEEYFSLADEYKNFVPLAGFTTNGPQIMSVKKHVSTPADLQGLKVRVEGAQQIELFERLGASPVGAPGLNSFELLTGGVVDAGISPFGPGMVQGMVGVTNEITLVPGGFSRSGFTLVMNRDKFESLPENARNALLSTSGVALSARLGAVVDDEEQAGRAKFEEAGATITEASPDLVGAVREHGRFIVDSWLKIAEERGLDGQEVLDFYLARVAAGKE